MSANRLYQSHNTSAPIKEIKCLLVHQVFCHTNKKFRDYQQTLRHVYYEVNNSLDVVSLLRRLRTHGFTLALFVGKNTVKSNGQPRTLFDLFGEIGGLVEFFYVVISGLVSLFAPEEVTAHTANRLYYDDTVGVARHPMSKLKCLLAHQIVCFRNEKFKEYRKKMKFVETDVNSSLDLFVIFFGLKALGVIRKGGKFLGDIVVLVGNYDFNLRFCVSEIIRKMVSSFFYFLTDFFDPF